jgi:dUTP pyrophosphatase
MIKIKLLHEQAKPPVRSTDGAAGLDLYALLPVEIWPGAQVSIPTGIAVAIEPGWYGRIAPRSGLAARHGLNVHAGVVDADYRGELHVCLINHGDGRVEIRPGDRIAQLIIERCWMGEPEVVASLDDTDRGAGGFGSTGT